MLELVLLPREAVAVETTKLPRGRRGSAQRQDRQHLVVTSVAVRRVGLAMATRVETRTSDKRERERRRLTATWRVEVARPKQTPPVTAKTAVTSENTHADRRRLTAARHPRGSVLVAA